MELLSPYRKAGALILLIALIAGLLPVRQASASAANSGTAVVVSATKVRDSFYIANAMDRLTGNKRYEAFAFGLILQEMYEHNPGLQPAQATNALLQLQDRYNASSQSQGSQATKTANEVFTGILASLSTAPVANDPWLASVVGAAQKTWDVFAGGSLIDSDGENRVTAPQDMVPSTRAMTQLQQVFIGEILGMAAQNHSFGETWDQFLGPILNVSVYDSTQAIVASSPTLKSLQGIQQLIGSDGKILAQLGDLKEEVDFQFDILEAGANETLNQLAALDAKQTQLLKYATDAAKRQVEQAQAEQRAAQTQAKLDAAKSGLYLLSTFVGLADPKLGNEISVVGDAAIKIGEALNTYQKAVAGLGALQALTNLSTVVLTGNVVGAVMSILPLFVDSGPTPDQMILQQIGGLRDQVRDLRLEMHDRFDRIDESLNTIYDTLNTRFDQIDLTLGELQGDVHEIQKELVLIQKSMNRFEANMYNLLNDGFRRPLWERINGWVGYRARTGAEMRYQPDYVDSENIFQSWATIHAFDALATGPATRLYDDDHLYDELTRYPLDTNIGYLSQWLQQRQGLPTFATGQLANPRDWAISSRAYTELAMDWPVYASQIAPARAAAVAQVGTTLEKSLARIANTGTAAAPQANYQLFDRLASNYNDKALALDLGLRSVENSYLDTLRQRGPGPDDDRHGQLDLWGSATQPLDPRDLPNVGTMLPCEDYQSVPDNSLNAPNNNLAVMLPAPYLVARYFGYGDAEICYGADFADVWTNSGKAYGYLRVEIASFYSFVENGQPRTRYIGSRFVRLNTPIQISVYRYGEWIDTADPYDEAGRNWTSNANMKAQFEAGSSLTTRDQALLDQVTAQVNNRLRAEQHGLYQDIVEGLGAGPLNVAANRLTGAKAVLGAFIELGLPRALENDEFLRSFLYGDQRLIDEDSEERITGTYMQAALNLPAQNVRHDLMDMTNERIDALYHAQTGSDGAVTRSGILPQYLAQIGLKTYAESQRMVETALNRLVLAGSMIRTPLASVAPLAVDFGRTLVSTASATRPVKVTNSGLAAPVTISSISITGANAAEFTETHSCSMPLPVGASCILSLTFKPAASGARAATLNVVSNAPDSPYTIALSGSGMLPAPAQNLLPNAGFELDANNDTRPDGWTVSPNLTRSDLVKRSGAYAMKHASATDATYKINSALMHGLVPGTLYTFAGWVNIPVPSTPDANGFSFKMEVEWRNGTNAVIGTSSIKTYTAPTGGAWTRASASMVAPAGTTSAIARMVAVSVKGPIYVDDVFFGNLLANPAFELDANADSRPDNWTINAHVTRSNTMKRSEDYAMRHTATDNASYVISQVVTGLTPGSRYTIGGYVNIPVTADAFGFRLEVQWRDAANLVIGTTPIKSFTTHTNGAWTAVSSDMQVPAGAKRGIVLMVATSLNATVYVDDLSLWP